MRFNPNETPYDDDIGSCSDGESGSETDLQNDGLDDLESSGGGRLPPKKLM